MTIHSLIYMSYSPRYNNLLILTKLCQETTMYQIMRFNSAIEYTTWLIPLNQYLALYHKRRGTRRTSIFNSIIPTFITCSRAGSNWLIDYMIIIIFLHRHRWVCRCVKRNECKEWISLIPSSSQTIKQTLFTPFLYTAAIVNHSFWLTMLYAMCSEWKRLIAIGSLETTRGMERMWPAAGMPNAILICKSNTNQVGHLTYTSSQR